MLTTEAVRLRQWVFFLAIAYAAVTACGLNPQPEPPGAAGDDTGGSAGTATGGAGGSTVGAGGTAGGIGGGGAGGAGGSATGGLGGGQSDNDAGIYEPDGSASDAGSDAVDVPEAGDAGNQDGGEPDPHDGGADAAKEDDAG